jgi:hypothetical protein
VGDGEEGENGREREDKDENQTYACHQPNIQSITQKVMWETEDPEQLDRR